MSAFLSRWYFFLALCLFVCIGCKSKSASSEIIEGNLAILPLPASMTPSNGHFLINEKIKFLTDSSKFSNYNPFKVFNEVFEKKSGYAIPFHYQKGTLKDSANLITVILVLNSNNSESYSLKIEASGIFIAAGSELGVFYALQSLRQIMRLDAVDDYSGTQRHWSVPTVAITDAPRFAYRGMHFDVCRHFMPVEFVKKYIDLLAFYKMNRFHWHLTDDQGWRIEIKKYPKLQEIAAWRDATLIGHYTDRPVRYDSTRYGGFYTQEEIKEVVAYASSRAVTIIPEIEMPGHAQAALSAYPELACTPGPFKAATSWGVFEDVFCPTEETFTFLQNVLDEVIALFPSPYIHIGGDECPKTRWEQSEFCRDLMKKEGLKNTHELQSYFIQRIEKYLNSKGKNIIGWDEILEGGLAPNATVMSWRGMQGGIDAARSGHDVIMSPGPPCYFDAFQSDPSEEPLAIGGLTTLENVYSFEPIPAELTSTEAKHILGGQGNLWTEYISTPEKAEYMAYPRAIALAEVLWTPVARKSWPDFTSRLHQHFDRLDGMHVNYAKHLNLPSVDIHADSSGLSLTWISNVPDQIIYYTNDTTNAKWDQAKANEKTLVTDAGSIFYKSDQSATRQIIYQPSKLKDAHIKVSPSPDERYPGRQGIQTLTDGLKGNKFFNGLDWCAWDGKKFVIDIEFPRETVLDSIKIGILSSPDAWIYPPESLKISGSSDVNHYGELASQPKKEVASGRQDLIFSLPGIKVRYLRIEVLPYTKIPVGSPGAGSKAWAFIDEIGVY